VRPRRILVCSSQVPFVRGGAELHVQSLVHELREEGYEVELVALPFQDYPHESLVRHAGMWRFMDLDADVVITTKFPSYFVKHPKKIVWLFHNYRAAYDLYGTNYSGYSRNRPDDLQLVEWIRNHDREYLSEALKILTISRNVQRRLKKYLNLDGDTLYAPSLLQPRIHCRDYQPFVFVAQRLDAFKRTELLIEALAETSREYKAVIAGSGPEESKLRALVRERNLDHRVEFVGKISDEQLINYYATCGLVYFAPYDEDYGLTTLEAFQAKKPVITALDSGGPLEFVEHRINGWIADAEPSSIARGIDTILEDSDLARKMGESGFEKIQPITWRRAISRLREVFKNLHL